MGQMRPVAELARIDALSLRERGMVFGASIAVFLPDDRTRLQPVVRLTDGKPSPLPFRAFPAQELFVTNPY